MQLEAFIRVRLRDGFTERVMAPPDEMAAEMQKGGGRSTNTSHLGELKAGTRLWACA
jgi:hypothetical protein